MKQALVQGDGGWTRGAYFGNEHTTMLKLRLSLLPCVVQPSTKSTVWICSMHFISISELNIVTVKLLLGQYYIEISLQVVYINTDFHCGGGRFKWSFLLYRQLRAYVSQRKALAFHNLCVWHATFNAAEQCQYYLCGSVWRAMMKTVSECDYWSPPFGVRKSRGKSESERSRHLNSKLRPWRFVQFHMPQKVVVLIYMKISQNCVHVSLIISPVGDFHCFTKQDCFHLLLQRCCFCSVWGEIKK